MTDPGPRPMMDAAAVVERCLAAIVDHHEQQGWDLPERRYIAAGNSNQVAADDEHLLVTLDGLNPGASDTTQRAGGVQSKGAAQVVIARAALVIRLMRCVPVADEYGPPSVDELARSSRRILDDVGRVMSSLYAWRRAESGPALNGAVTLGQVEAIGPEGALAGHLWFVTISPVQ